MQRQAHVSPDMRRDMILNDLICCSDIKLQKANKLNSFRRFLAISVVDLFHRRGGGEIAQFAKALGW